CDTYALSLSGVFGGFPGSLTLAAFLLFLLGMAVILIPGWFLSRITSAVLLGVIDSVFGLFTGAVVGLIAISLLLMFVVPMVPKIERSQAWKKSTFVKSWARKLENAFGSPKFKPLSFGKSLEKKLAPITQSALDQAKKTANRWEKVLK
ncbi:MAG: CvpA family protein, partial [Elusimicrobia bacterium]|nr:CvpA family protein [Candidatus Obscuribacterium magneticum]